MNSNLDKTRLYVSKANKRLYRLECLAQSLSNQVERIKIDIAKINKEIIKENGCYDCIEVANSNANNLSTICTEPTRKTNHSDSQGLGIVKGLVP